MQIFLQKINKLSELHFHACLEYRSIINSLYKGIYKGDTLENIPFIPVTLFKEFNLKSIPDKNVFKILQSSGTQGKQSSIFLSRDNSRDQTIALKSLFQKQFGNTRVPMVIFDSEQVIHNNFNLSARRAAIVGFSSFASERIFVLQDDLSLNHEILNQFLSHHKDTYFILFGFTFILWNAFFAGNDSSVPFKAPNAIILHGGGWKSLESLGISKNEFKTQMKEKTGITKIIDYYGMAEQAGSIFFECNFGYFHTSEYSNVIIRNPFSMTPVPFGQTGLVQVLSSLPSSYPGHSILTQDLGTLLGEDDCHCGEQGRYFTIESRLPNSQIRGCSDVGI